MYYKGKTMDMFEAAVGQLLDYHGCCSVGHIDCMSCRCFGYRMGDSIAEWFRPRIEIEKAVENIGIELGIRIRCGRAEHKKDYGHICETYGAAVIGPVIHGPAAPTIHGYYYQGAETYLFVEKISPAEYRISDPRGLPGILFKEDELERIVEEDDLYFIYIENPYVIKKVNWLSVLKKGIQYHHKVWEDESREIQGAVRAYRKNDKSADRIALRCAVINLGIQIDKVWTLAWERNLVNHESERKYIYLKTVLYQSGKEEDPEKIYGLLKEIWGLIEDVGKV